MKRIRTRNAIAERQKPGGDEQRKLFNTNPALEARKAAFLARPYHTLTTVLCVPTASVALVACLSLHLLPTRVHISSHVGPFCFIPFQFISSPSRHCARCALNFRRGGRETGASGRRFPIKAGCCTNAAPPLPDRLDATSLLTHTTSVSVLSLSVHGSTAQM